MAGEQSVFNTDIQIIRDYVTLRDETLQALITQFNAALNNFETTIRSSSPTEAKPHILGVLAKSAVKIIEKQITSAIHETIHVDVAPVVELAHAINDEMERAKTATTSLQVGNWITALRSSVNNVLTQQITFEALQEQYGQSDEGGRSDIVADVGEQLNALTPVAGGLKSITNQIFECGLYEDWINAHFTNDCMDGEGNIHIDLNGDGEVVEVTVNAPLGDKIEGAFNSRLLGQQSGAVPGLDRISGIKVGKKVSIGDRSGCFDDRNKMTKGSDFLTDDQLVTGLNAPREFVRS
jgi:hypothetical protein